MPRYFKKITPEELEDKIKYLWHNHEDFDFDDYEPGQEMNYVYYANLSKQIVKDLSKVEFSDENYHDGSENSSLVLFTGYHQLENGLSFRGCLASGDWESFTFFILYFDGKSVRGYIPSKGNVYNRTLKSAYGNNDEDGEDLKDFLKHNPTLSKEDFDGLSQRGFERFYDFPAMIENIKERIVEAK